MDELELSVGPPNPDLPPEPGEWMRRFASVPLLYQPGRTWMYNTGAEVLGVLIARGGRPFESFLAERIFEPLGMVDTGFSVPADKLDRLPPHYAPDPGTEELTVYDDSAGRWSRPPAFPSGGGGLVSTADDYLAFTSWTSDPLEEMVVILMTTTMWTSPTPPPVFLDFRTSPYQAIDD